MQLNSKRDACMDDSGSKQVTTWFTFAEMVIHILQIWPESNFNACNRPLSLAINDLWL